MIYCRKKKRRQSPSVVELCNNTVPLRVYSFSFSPTSWMPMANTFVCPSFMFPWRLHNNQHRPLKRDQNTKKKKVFDSLAENTQEKLLETTQANTTKCHNLKKNLNLTNNGVIFIQILMVKEHAMVNHKINIKLYQWRTHHFSCCKLMIVRTKILHKFKRSRRLQVCSYW